MRDRRDWEWASTVPTFARTTPLESRQSDIAVARYLITAPATSHLKIVGNPPTVSTTETGATFTLTAK